MNFKSDYQIIIREGENVDSIYLVLNKNKLIAYEKKYIDGYINGYFKIGNKKGIILKHFIKNPHKALKNNRLGFLLKNDNTFLNNSISSIKKYYEYQKNINN